MSSSSKALKFISLNVRGIVSPSKRRKVFLWFANQRADVIFIQESHCIKSKLNAFKRSWEGRSYYGLTDSAHSRGVGILFNPNLEVNICDTHSSNDGRKLLLNVDICGQLITLVNVYAPNNELDRITFYADLKEWISNLSHNINNVIVGGDFNCCLNQNDRSSQTHISDKSRNSLNIFLKQLQLYDAWSISSTKGTYHYTWQDNTVKSRLDYFFISNLCKVKVQHCNTVTVISDQAGKRVTDHRALVLKSNISIPIKWPGYWKLNTSLLKDENYCNEMINLVSNFKYDPSILGLSNSLKWDLLKTKIKQKSIQISTMIARMKRDNINILEEQLLQLDQKNDLTDEELLRKAHIQNQLHEYYIEKSEGAQIRSRTECIVRGECNNEYFKNLENARQSNKVITTLNSSDGVEIHDQRMIIHIMSTFYSNLYSSCNPEQETIDNFLNTIHIDGKLNEKEKGKLESFPSVDECTNAIMKINENKSPGSDGIPIEFYKKFWNVLQEYFLDMVEESWHAGTLPFSTKLSVISVFHKAGDKNDLKNYRPLSLTNTDYKIITHVFAERLQDVISSVIHTDQAGYIRGRYIGCSIRNLLDLYEYTEESNIPGAFLSIDFEKAFDTVERKFLFSVLKTFNFGENFIKWMMILNEKPMFKVKNNVWLSGNCEVKI